MRSGQTQRARLLPLALLVIVSTSIALQSASSLQDVSTGTDGFSVREEILDDGGLPPLPLRFLFSPQTNQPQRIVDSTRNALLLLGRWFEKYPGDHLTIVDIPWRVPDDLGRDDSTVVISSRWLTPARDVGGERAIIVALTRAYFESTAGRVSTEPATQALVRYTSARAINELLQGRDVPTLRLFGGFLPYAVRSVSLSRPRRDPRPPFRAYDELGHATEAVSREADALHTLERVIGWPAMQAALVEYLTLRPSAAPAPAFIEVVNRQRGEPVTWWPPDNFRSASIDGSVTSLASDHSHEGGSFETRIQVRREMTAVRSLPPLDVRTSFSDGTEIRERIVDNSRDIDLAYVSSSPALSAAVDPDAVILVDSNRLNNLRSLTTPTSSVGWRMAFNWMSWLQHLTLTYMAFV